MAELPIKGSVVINPGTNRPILVGGPTWSKLVKSGVFAGVYNDPNELCEIQEGDNIEEKIHEQNQNLPAGYQSVRGRGKYANKIVKRNKKMNTAEIAEYVSKVASRVAPTVYAENPDEDDDEISNILQTTILEEMMNTSTIYPARTKKSKTREAVASRNMVYNIADASSSESEAAESEAEEESEAESEAEEDSDEIEVEDISDSE